MLWSHQVLKNQRRASTKEYFFNNLTFSDMGIASFALHYFAYNKRFVSNACISVILKITTKNMEIVWFYGENCIKEKLDFVVSNCRLFVHILMPSTFHHVIRHLIVKQEKIEKKQEDKPSSGHFLRYMLHNLLR